MNFPEIENEQEGEAGIFFNFENVEIELPDESKLADWLAAAATSEGKSLGEVNYIFCSDEYLLGINQEYLQHDYFTDVITFPYSDVAVAGDIFISTERVADNARSVSASFQHELCRVMVHGLLHLVGYDDSTDELRGQMSEKEDFYLSKLT